MSAFAQDDQSRLHELYRKDGPRILLRCQRRGEPYESYVSETVDGAQRVVLSERSLKIHTVDIKTSDRASPIELIYGTRMNGKFRESGREFVAIASGSEIKINLRDQSTGLPMNCLMSFGMSAPIRFADSASKVHLMVHPHRFYDPVLDLKKALESKLQNPGFEHHVMLEALDVPFEHYESLRSKYPVSESGLLGPRDFRDSPRSVTVKGLADAQLHIAPTGWARFDVTGLKNPPSQFLITGGFWSKCIARMVNSLLRAYSATSVTTLDLYFNSDSVMDVADFGFGQKLDEFRSEDSEDFEDRWREFTGRALAFDMAKTWKLERAGSCEASLGTTKGPAKVVRVHLI